MNDQILTLLIQKSPRAVQPAIAARAAAQRQNATLARSLLAQAAQAALADEQADLDPQDRALLAQLIAEPGAAINTRGKGRQFKFRLTDSEYLELLRRAATAGMSASAYVRHKALYEES